MAAFKFTCPACSKRLSSASPLPVGRHVRCPRCATEFQIAGDEPPAAAAPFPSARAEKGYDPGPADEPGPWDWAAGPPQAEAPVEPADVRGEEPVPTGDEAPVQTGYELVGETGPAEAGYEPVAAADPADEPVLRIRDGQSPRQGGALHQGLLIGGAVAGLLVGVGLLLFALVPSGSGDAEPEQAAAPPAEEAPPEREPPFHLDPELPVWEAEPGRVDLLAPETAVPDAAGFRFRPPRGYTYSQQSAGGVSWSAWIGPVRDDGSRPWLEMTPYSPPQEGPRRLDMEAALARFLDDFKAAQLQLEFPQTAYTPVEKGQMSRLAVLRTYLTQNNPATGLTLRGFVYLVTDGPTRLVFMYRDRVPHDETSRRLAEASVQTLHK